MLVASLSICGGLLKIAKHSQIYPEVSEKREFSFICSRRQDRQCCQSKEGGGCWRNIIATFVWICQGIEHYTNKTWDWVNELGPWSWRDMSHVFWQSAVADSGTDSPDCGRLDQYLLFQILNANAVNLNIRDCLLPPAHAGCQYFCYIIQLHRR